MCSFVSSARLDGVRLTFLVRLIVRECRYILMAPMCVQETPNFLKDFPNSYSVQEIPMSYRVDTNCDVVFRHS